MTEEFQASSAAAFLYDGARDYIGRQGDVCAGARYLFWLAVRAVHWVQGSVEQVAGYKSQVAFCESQALSSGLLAGSGVRLPSG